MADFNQTLSSLSLCVCLPPTVWRIRYVSSERGTTIKTNYWIDVRQAVVSLPCFFCLCPASALLHIISLYFVFHSVCFSATLRRKIKRFLLWHCSRSLTCQYTVRFEQVVPHCWPLLNHWPSTFHCSCVCLLSFLPPTVSESIKVDLIHSSLSKKKCMD